MPADTFMKITNTVQDMVRGGAQPTHLLAHPDDFDATWGGSLLAVTTSTGVVELSVRVSAAFPSGRIHIVPSFGDAGTYWFSTTGGANGHS